MIYPAVKMGREIKCILINERRSEKITCCMIHPHDILEKVSYIVKRSVVAKFSKINLGTEDFRAVKTI